MRACLFAALLAVCRLYAHRTKTTQVSKYNRVLADACPMTAAQVLRAISQMAFYIAEPLVYLKKGVCWLFLMTCHRREYMLDNDLLAMFEG